MDRGIPTEEVILEMQQTRVTRFPGVPTDAYFPGRLVASIRKRGVLVEKMILFGEASLRRENPGVHRLDVPVAE